MSILGRKLGVKLSFLQHELQPQPTVSSPFLEVNHISKMLIGQSVNQTILLRIGHVIGDDRTSTNQRAGLKLYCHGLYFHLQIVRTVWRNAELDRRPQGRLSRWAEETAVRLLHGDGKVRRAGQRSLLYSSSGWTSQTQNWAALNFTLRIRTESSSHKCESTHPSWLTI